MPPKSEDRIHLVGFGSQGFAWAECLKQSGWQVDVYLGDKGKSFQKALEHGYRPTLIEELTSQIQDTSTLHWIAMMCPDSKIAGIYGDLISSSPARVRLILAHGYVVYSGELKLNTPRHQAALLAPKAIGPKLLQNFQTSFPHPHHLVAGFYAPTGEEEDLKKIARGLGFDSHSLALATFEEEAIGDLMSEQGLLCGGVFNLLEWTMEAMEKAGIPDALIREECLTELELIAGLIRERGPSQTFRAISQAAQSGTIAMRERFEASQFKKEFFAQMEEVKTRRFASYFQSPEWRKKADSLTNQLSRWEDRLRKSSPGKQENE